MSNKNGPVQSVAKALRLLDLLMEAHQPLTLAALSEQTGWPKSTIHGLLSTMRESARSWTSRATGATASACGFLSTAAPWAQAGAFQTWQSRICSIWQA